MVLYNDGSYSINPNFPDTDFLGDADYVVPDGSVLAEKIFAMFPNFVIVTDDNGNITDVSATEPAPIPVPAPTDHERLEALEQAFMEFVSEVV